jgi:hypothetical protein
MTTQLAAAVSFAVTFLTVRLHVRTWLSVALLLGGLSALPVHAQCVEAGGKVFCGSQVPKQFTYGLCDEFPASTLGTRCGARSGAALTLAACARAPRRIRKKILYRVP